MTEAGEIYTKVGFNAFKQAFSDVGRGDSFTDKGFEALYELIKRESADINEPYELDVVEICGNYEEYETIEEYNEENSSYWHNWCDVPVFGAYITDTKGAICYSD